MTTVSFQATAKYKRQANLVLIEKQQINNGNFLFSFPSLKREILSLRRTQRFTAENGEVFPLIIDKRFILLIGVGKKEETSLTTLRITIRKAFLSSYLNKIREIELIPHDKDDATIQAIIEGIYIGTYAWRKYKTEEKNDKIPRINKIFITVQDKKIYQDTITISQGVNLTRDLINDNADVVHSEYLQRIIKGLVKNKKHISLEILNRKELQQRGLNLHLAVNKGSKKEPKLIIAHYHGATSQEPTYAIIGKGITYDTGGLNIKPSGSMETMRMDMSGAAAVIGILKNTVSLGIKKNVIFVTTIAENAVDAESYKPGDVFKSYQGKTVEIGNTDAEGRLVLADAIAYIVKNYNPDYIIDIATLTGACVIALGNDYTGLVCNDDAFARRLVHCSNETDDRIWRLPTYPELKDSVKSLYADIKNVGFPKGAAGALTAAEFLRQFINNKKWAHLDIAGSAFAEGQGRWYYSYGATGASVRLLTSFLLKP